MADAIVKDYLRRRIVERTQSTYCSPGFLVKKYNGKHCIVVDYAKITTKTRLINQPVLRLSQFNVRAYGKKVFSCLDLTNTFYCI